MCVFRVQENDDAGNPRGDVTPDTYGNFSETQTESQVITLYSAKYLAIKSGIIYSQVSNPSSELKMKLHLNLPC